MLQVKVSSNVDEVNRLAASFAWSRQRIYLVLRRAVNKTGRYVYTRVVRHISADTGIQQKKVKARFVRLSLPKEHFPVAKIKIMDKGTPLIELHPKKTPTGILFRSGGGTEERVGAFKATMPRGHVGIFMRKGSPRLPIKEQYKSVVIEEMSKRIDEVRVDAGGRLMLEIRRQIDVMLNTMRRGGKMRRAEEVGQTASASTPVTRLKWALSQRSPRGTWRR